MAIVLATFAVVAALMFLQKAACFTIQFIEEFSRMDVNFKRMDVNFNSTIKARIGRCNNGLLKSAWAVVIMILLRVLYVAAFKSAQVLRVWMRLNQLQDQLCLDTYYLSSDSLAVDFAYY